MTGDGGNRVNEAKLHHILLSDLDRVKTSLGHDVIHMGFQCKPNLGNAVGPHCSSGWHVGVDRIGLSLDCPHRIHHPESVYCIGNQCVCMARICSLVGVGFDASCSKGSIRANIALNVELHCVSCSCTGKGLFPGIGQNNWSATNTSGQECIQGFGKRILLIAESTTNIGFYNPDLAKSYSQGLGTDTTHDMGNLGGAYHDNLAIFLICKRVCRFNMTVGYDWGLVVAYDFDKALFLNGLFKGADLIGRVDHYVVWLLLVDYRCPFLHCIFNREDGSILFVGYLDLSHCFFCSNLSFGNNCCNVIGIAANPCIEQLTVSDILVFGFGRPWVPCSRELNVGNVETGDDVYNPFNLPRLGEVKLLYPAICNGTMQYFCMKGMGRDQIGGIFCFSRHFVVCIDSVRGFSYDIHGVPPCFLNNPASANSGTRQKLHIFSVKDEHRSFQKGRAFFSYFHNTTNCNKFKELFSISEKKAYGLIMLLSI